MSTSGDTIREVALQVRYHPEISAVLLTGGYPSDDDLRRVIRSMKRAGVPQLASERALDLAIALAEKGVPT